MKLFLLFILSCGHADQACGRRSHFQSNISLSIWIDKRSSCKERAKELAENYGMEKDEFLKTFGGLDMVKYDLKMRKAIDVLKED